jgi:hypothetical protein
VVQPGTISISRRYRGPAASGNGGYASGLLAGFLDAPAVEVTLRAPPPLERPLEVELDGDGARLLDGEALVAEAVPAAVPEGVPGAVGLEEATAAAFRYAGFAQHVFPECFVCGPARAPGDGLRIFAGPVAGREDIVAAPWTAREVEPALVWAAIDCPGAFAVGLDGRGEVVLGRMTAAVHRLPAEGERCVAAGWARGEDGRKLHAGTALFSEAGEVLARAHQTWIAPRPASDSS